MLELTDDYLAAESELVNAISSVTALRKVYTSVDLAETAERSQITPAAHVIYAGDRQALTAQGGSVGHVVQTWYVVLTVNLKSKDKAGPLLAQLITALSGVMTTLGPINRVNAPRPNFRAGFGYYPLAFELKFKTQRLK